MSATMADHGTIRAYDNVHWFHPWEEMAAFGQNGRTIVAGGEGIYVEDETGRKLIDGPGGMWCVQVGYGNRDIARAIGDQALQLGYVNPYSMSTGPAALLARKLATLAPGDLDHVFFTTGGSTAVETAIRFLHYRNNALGRPRKKIILAREDSYHGSTYLTASISGKVGNKENLDHATSFVAFVPSTHQYRFGRGLSEAEFCDQRVAAVEAIIEDLGAENIAGFIAEPIQASGGVIMAPEGYLQRVHELCRRNDIAYISDEVVTGFGRVGHWFASKEVFGIEPDIITCAKGLTSGYQPLGACLISKRLLADVTGDKAKGSWFAHGYTYSGHPVACAAALENIAVFERANLLEHVREVAPLFMERMQALRSIPIVGDVRGMGLVGCVDCVTGREDRDPWNPRHQLGERIDRHCQALGLIVRPIINMCVFSPPLVISPAEIERMFDILGQGLRLTLDELVREGIWKG